MKFNSLINNILGEEVSREDRIRALKTLKDTKENIPSSYRILVDDLINQHSLEELKSMLAMEKRMQERYNNGAPMYIKALEYAVAELE
jgi:hypothetical protein